MQVILNLPTDLEQDLVRQASQSYTPLQTLILQALPQVAQSPAVTTS